MNLKKRLGEKIQKLRTSRNLKQSELAEMVNIATKTQSCIETGKNFPSSDLLERYAMAFGVDVGEILDLTYIKQEDKLLDEINMMIKKASSEQITIIYKFLKSLTD